MITRIFKLCLNAGTGSAPYINVSQYDEGETWLFELYSETGERYIPSTGAIVGVKSDGHGIANTGTVDNEGRVVITETQQMTASAGRAIYELSIDGLTHGTANFIVAVERKPTDDAVMSDSDLSLIQEAIDSAEVIAEVIGDSDPSEVIGEHVDAWLDNHPEATTTVLDGAITAPKINNSLWDKLLVSEEASGAVASFEDGADDVPVSSLKVALEPIQTGTGDPSPTNIRPISGHSSVTVERCGKNLFDIKGWLAKNNISYTENDGFVSFTPTANAFTNFYELPSGIKTVSFSTGSQTTATNLRVRCKKADGTITDIYESTISLTADIVGVAMNWAQIGVISIKAMVEMGETVTDYEPYIGTSYPYSLGQSVYGGTVDLATGVLTVNKAIAVFDGSEDEGWNDYSQFNGYYTLYPQMNYGTRQSGISNMLVCSYSAMQGQTNAFWLGVNSKYIYLIGVYDTMGSTVSALKTYLASHNLEIVIPLATPTTVQLTPQEVKTLLGYNNISSSGTVNVIYHADTKLYVDKMTNVDNAIIAPTEQTFTATRNYTVNDLVIVNDTLYKVTANIASGSTITPNSNVQQTTLSALIKALS